MKTSLLSSLRLSVTALFFLVSPHLLGGQSDVEPIKTTHVYKTVDGHDILADVFAGPAESKRPAVIWIHGGGLIFGTRLWAPQAQLQRYLEAGYVLISIDHRLVPETKIPDILEDVKDAYGWVRTEGAELYNIDPDRIVVAGASSGGYLSLVSGYMLQPRPAAIVSLYGFGDLTGDWTTQPNPHFNAMPAISRSEALAVVGKEPISSGNVQYSPTGRPKFFNYTKQQGSWTFEATGHDPRTDSDWFEPYEPLANFDADYPPTLLVHGDLDTDVPVAQAHLMANALSEQGVVHELITHPDWEHLFDLNLAGDPEVEAVMDRIKQFVAQHVAN
ncbi:MAG: hypothetical protein SynsKO_01750 [Synoicihabitans sp.]